MHLDSSDVADCFSYAAKTYHDGVNLYAIYDSEYDLCNGTDGEDGNEDCVGS